jgi:hypothetical protein
MGHAQRDSSVIWYFDLITFYNCSKGNQAPFCKVQEGIWLPHAILFCFRGFFRFCMRYLIAFCTLQKGIWYLLDLKQKGARTLSNNVTSVFACALHETILYLSLKKEEKFWKYRKKMYLSGLELQLQYCLRNLRMECKAVQVEIPLGQQKLE